MREALRPGNEAASRRCCTASSPTQAHSVFLYKPADGKRIMAILATPSSRPEWCKRPPPRRCLPDRYLGGHDMNSNQRSQGNNQSSNGGNEKDVSSSRGGTVEKNN